jgi:FlaA1/EpsC-like NDP-sugar epimerase
MRWMADWLRRRIARGGDAPSSAATRPVLPSLPAFPRRRRLSDTPVNFADLLGRRPVDLDTPELQRFLAGKRVLVTGAGGSIGSEICRQAARFCPQRLVLVERAEGALFEIEQELRRNWIGQDVAPVVADVSDRARLERVFAKHRPHVVFHAAAHKHVPMMEHNAGEAIKNNVFGTLTCAEVAASHAVDAFVLISTDKAVNPSSVMGASKRVAELCVLGLQSGQWFVASGQKHAALPPSSLATGHSSPATRFVAVRFGNVLGSSGSVVPIFLKQIDAGGPVTVTHPDMRRYFMTIPEASQLVMQAGAIGRGGELFVLDMGDPVRILDLAERLIAHRGLRPGKDVRIKFTGIRPGEKLFEELSYGAEHTAPSGHDRIHVWKCPPVDPLRVRAMLDRLREVIDGDDDLVRATLANAIPEYESTTAKPPLKLVA